jgi:L-ribulose-5-phosphate 4-epimerase
VSAIAQVADTLVQLRAEVSRLHAHLPAYGLVVWTAGNVSARVPGHDLMVIKPSGVAYDELTPAAMVVCDLDGRVVDGEHAPSSDTEAQAYVYRKLPAVGGVVHTHSPYAVAWATRGEPIPCVTTMCADEFGGPIPVGPFATIGDDSIGRGIVETLRDSRSPAVPRADRQGRRQGGSHVRGRRPDGAPCPAARRADPDRPSVRRSALRPLPERLRTTMTAAPGRTTSS